MLISAPLFLALGLDTFAVALGLGISGLDRRQRVRVGLSFALAEGAMPLIGFFLGRAVAMAVGDAASYLAVALLLVVGLYTMLEALRGGKRAYRPMSSFGLVALALSVSLDELAVGFGLGLLHVPALLAVAFIAAQAFVMTMVGTALGRRIGAALAQRAELVSGLVLTVLACILLGEKLLSV